MARFDVYQYSNAVPLVLDVQAKLLSDLKTRVVVPLLPYSQAKKEELPRLKPVLTVKGKEYVMMTTDIGTLKVSDLGKVIANLEEERYAIIGAIDFLFQGF
jgi:toxin CcdB